MEVTTEVQEVTLEKVIETKLVQNNVTQQVLAALKEKYGGLKLKAVDDKESYLELKAAAKDCAKVRTLTVKICKEGRERAVKEQKLWIAKEKEIVSEVAVVENALDSEIAIFDNEVARKDNEEKQRKEEAYINRQAQLTKLGATYIAGSFVLGEASFEAELIKGSSQDIWEEAIVPKFQAEYNKIEAVRVEEERVKAEKETAMRLEQEKLRQEQESFRLQQEEFKRKQDEADRIERDKVLAAQREQDKLDREAEFERRKVDMEKQAEVKRLADIELAVKKEQERQAEEVRIAEIKRQQEELKRAEELAQSKDKDKWIAFINQVKLIEVHDMRSGQYRKKMQIAKEKLDEILVL